MDHIAKIRDFNRDYTVKLGLLDQSYLGSGLTLTQARVLQEVALAGAEGGSAREISERLGVDAGYLSRLFAGFTKKGWVQTRIDEADARRKLLTLTDDGRAAFAPLDSASRSMIESMTSHLPKPEVTELCQSLERVKQLLGPPSTAPIQFRDLETGDLGWITEAHGRLYAQDEGFDLSFEALVAGLLSDYVTKKHENSRAFIATTPDGARLGCTFVVHEADDIARLRMVLLEPQARGLGLGRRLLEMALSHAKSKGYAKMVLATHESHRAACAMYAKAGFFLVSSEPSQAFSQEVVVQVWEKSL